MTEGHSYPDVWTVSRHYAARHPAEIAAFIAAGGWVHVINVRRADLDDYWMSASPPPWLTAELDDRDSLAAMVARKHAERGEGRRAAWERHKTTISAGRAS